MYVFTVIFSIGYGAFMYGVGVGSGFPPSDSWGFGIVYGDDRRLKYHL